MLSTSHAPTENASEILGSVAGKVSLVYVKIEIRIQNLQMAKMNLTKTIYGRHNIMHIINFVLCSITINFVWFQRLMFIKIY